MSKANTDILIVGGGIIGLTVARELVQKGHQDIIIIDKEKNLSKHASGRNSGVLHAGLQYRKIQLRQILRLPVDGQTQEKKTGRQRSARRRHGPGNSPHGGLSVPLPCLSK